MSYVGKVGELVFPEFLVIGLGFIYYCRNDGCIVLQLNNQKTYYEYIVEPK
jgi:hypothetical protein